MKKNGILWFVCLLTLAGGLGMFIRLGYANPPETDFVFPETGTWTCEDLGITIMLDEGACVVIRGEDEISCSILRERGSDKLYVHCYEFNNPDYAFEHLFWQYQRGS